MLKNGEVGPLLAPMSTVDRTNGQAANVFADLLSDSLKRLKKYGSPGVANRAENLMHALNQRAVRISLIGQVKAGKTALTNAMIGRPNLLPSDINPWTSVITSVHLNTAKPEGRNAQFTFFKRSEWRNMVEVGGHLGEMAKRADYEDELVNLRAQVREMQARTQARLGKNFDLLLDSQHSFLGVSPALIKKYVCLGDDNGASDGRYADITKSADIYIQNDQFEIPTVLCDTPGVNDPFLMREAVTLKNLSKADICIVVLSAHQALSTVDIGLMRILTALKNSQLVLFVNRIDELSDPDAQIIEIDKYIREILQTQKMSSDIPIVFGSAAWAEVASAGSTEMIADDRSQTLWKFAEKRAARLGEADTVSKTGKRMGAVQDNFSKLTDLSGLYELQTILHEKSATEVMQPRLTSLGKQALDLTEQSLVYYEEVLSDSPQNRAAIDTAVYFDELDRVLEAANAACLKISKDLAEQVISMMTEAFEEFLRTETTSLKAFLRSNGDIREWSADSEKLRWHLNNAHRKFALLAPARVDEIFMEVTASVEQIYERLVSGDKKLITLHAPTSDTPKAPVSLMRTMALDMNTGRFASWFRRNVDSEKYVVKLTEITNAEMETTLQDMHEVYVRDFVSETRNKLYEFLVEHTQTLQNLLSLSNEKERADVIKDLGLDVTIRKRIEELNSIRDDLLSLTKSPTGEKCVA